MLEKHITTYLLFTVSVAMQIINTEYSYQPVSIACLMCLCVGLQYCDGHGEQEGGWRRGKKNPESITFHLK